MAAVAALSAAVVAVVLAPGLTSSPTAAAVTGPDQVPLADVVSSLPVGRDVPALYVLVVDTSASMQEDGRYEGVGQAVTDFVAALSPGDQVSVVTFDVAPRRCGAGAFDAADVASVVGCLPPTAEGEFTDVGRALDEAIDVLAGEEVAVRSLVLVSDGAQEPAPGSPYTAETIGQEGPWLDLLDRAGAVGEVDAYALPLLGSPSAEVLGAVFPSPTILRAESADEIRAALDLPRQATQTAQARRLLAADVDRGVAVESTPPEVAPGEPQTWEVTLRSGAEHVPYRVMGLQLEVAGGAGVDLDVEGMPDVVRLDPGETVTLRPSVVVTVADGGEPEPPTLPVRLAGDVASPWDGALADLGLDGVGGVAADLGEVRLAFPPTDEPAAAGPAPALARWVVLTTALLLIVAGAFMAWRVMRPRPDQQP